MQQQLSTYAILHQPMLVLSDRRAGLWRIGMRVLDGRTSHPIGWEGYALSSIDATGKALAWAEDKAS